MKKLIITYLLAVITIQCQAKSIYQVEMIIFSHLTPTALNSESWPLLSSPAINLSHAWGLTPSKAEVTNSNEAKTYTLLPNYDFKQNAVAEKLLKDPKYQVILHVAWRQPLTSAKHARWVHIYGGKGYSEEGDLALSSIDGATPYTDARYWQIDGVVRFDVHRYINSSYNLFMGVPTGKIREMNKNDHFNDTNSQLMYFNLNQNRRMKSKELNFIGHPLFGALVYVTKVKDAKGAESIKHSAASQ